MVSSLRWLFPLLLAFALAAACSGSDDDDSGSAPPQPTPTPARSEQTATAEPTATSTPTEEPTPEPTLTPTPTEDPTLAENEAIIVGSDIRVRSQPSTQSEAMRSLEAGERIRFKQIVSGENWIVGTQTWGIAHQDWHDKWYELEEGGYVYVAFIFRPNLLETPPWELPEEGERWVEVNTSTQELVAYVGDQPVFTAQVSTGKPGFETPPGSWAMFNRVENALMTSEQAGYGPDEQYRVENVLFTQYFTGAGDALHLNYWRPLDYFGNLASSHGCVGLWIHDAQWLWMFSDGHDLRVDVHG